MASSTEPQTQHPHNPISGFSCFIQSNLWSLFAPKSTPFLNISPIIFTESSPQSLSLPATSLFNSTSSEQSSSVAKGLSPASRLPSNVRITSVKSSGKGNGPAFLGQVFSMCDLSGTGLMAVSTHLEIPFISQSTPQWLKKTFAAVTKSERKGPVFRFFMDLGDAVSYVKRLNIPSGVVGACRLDLAYEHFMEQPQSFQFVPNEKQVKEANKLLKLNGEKKKVDGVPVFGAENLDIAIATTDGIKWYAPYFFDKNMLDNILEDSLDQHFNTLIQSRHLQRRREIVDDNVGGSEAFEEIAESVFEPPEVQEVLDEIGVPGIPFSVISKAVEMEVLYAVDKLLLGNRWLRKATGIQPKFPYTVDSFEKRSVRASNLSVRSKKVATSVEDDEMKNNAIANQPDFQFPFGDWSSHPQLEEAQKNPNKSRKEELDSSRFLPKITMVGISTAEGGQVSKTNMKKSIEKLTRELERTEHGNVDINGTNDNEMMWQERDPLFVANVGDAYSGMSKSGPSRWVRSGSN